MKPTLDITAVVVPASRLAVDRPARTVWMVATDQRHLSRAGVIVNGKPWQAVVPILALCALVDPVPVLVDHATERIGTVTEAVPHGPTFLARLEFDRCFAGDRALDAAAAGTLRCSPLIHSVRERPARPEDLTTVAMPPGVSLPDVDVLEIGVVKEISITSRPGNAGTRPAYEWEVESARAQQPDLSKLVVQALEMFSPPTTAREAIDRAGQRIRSTADCVRRRIAELDSLRPRLDPHAAVRGGRQT